MKTRKQKVISRIFCTIVSILLLASFFVVPVSADDGYYFTFTPSLDLEDDNFSYLFKKDVIYDFGSPFEVGNVSQIYGGWDKITPVEADGDIAIFEYTFDDFYSRYLLVYPMGISSLTREDEPVSIFEGDTLYLEAGRFNLSFETQYDAVISARFTIRDCIPSIGGAGIDGQTFGTVYATTDDFDIYVSEGSNPYFKYDRLEFEVVESVTTPIYLCLEMVGTSADPLEIKILNVESNTARVFFGPGKSPNNPIYPSAPGKDDVDGLGSAEHELIQSQQQGINAGLNVMGDTSTVLTDLNSSLQLGAFATQLSGILDKIVTIPGIDALVQVSLALGLFASLMALSASIISAADRKAGQAKREAARETKRDKKK